MDLPRLYVNNIGSLDWLVALEFGRVDDGQPRERWRPVEDRFAYLTDGDETVGFRITQFSKFDPELLPIWEGPRFHVPQLGLTDSPAGEIAVAVRALLGDRSTFNRMVFQGAARAEDPNRALSLWLACLTCGDAMAHFGLGYTLYELGRYREAYRHLRYYATIAPGHPWNWCWYGRAAEAIGELAEARMAYKRTIELDDSDAAAVAAKVRLAALGSRQSGSGKAISESRWPLTATARSQSRTSR